MFPTIEVTAVLVSSLICFAIGALWLSPALFGKVWLKSLNIPADEYSRYIDGRTFLWLAVFVIGINIGIEIVIDMLGYTNMKDGVYAGIYMWIIFVVPQVGILIAFERRPFLLFAIYAGYFLVIFVIASALFAMWR
ncbi:MAG: DUF1761 domain-containing protein [Ignavibacteriales bacterium]|nr:DUF1761 domain-containing protein [Ignavibacteriales bacterium]